MRKILFLLFLVFAALLALSCSSDNGMPCVTCDNSGKQPEPEYKGGSCDIKDSVKIGDQIWMAKNSDCYVQGSKCYNNDSINCKEYGRLYDWATAKDSAKKICPAGWHLPSIKEWEALIDFVEKDNECNKCAGKYLKSQDGWKDDGNGLDTYVFSAKPSGYGDSKGYLFVGVYGLWWSADEDKKNISNAYSLNISVGDQSLDEPSSKDYLLSVRCLKDS